MVVLSFFGQKTKPFGKTRRALRQCPVFGPVLGAVNNTDDIFKTRMGVDDERLKNTFEFEFLMRSDMSNSSLLMR